MVTLDYTLLVLSIFLLSFIKTGKYVDSFGISVSVAYLVLFYIKYFN